MDDSGSRGCWARRKEEDCVIPWIIERLDRKLADAIGSNTEKCDVSLSRTNQPLTFDILRVFNTFHRIFYISVFDYTDFPCFELKNEEDLLLEKTVRWYKTGRGKRQ